MIRKATLCTQLFLFWVASLHSQRYYDRGRTDPTEEESGFWTNEVNTGFWLLVIIVLIVYSTWNQFFRKKEERGSSYWPIIIFLIILMVLGFLVKTGIESLFPN